MANNTIILTQPENETVLNHEIPNEASARLNYDVQDIEGLAIGPNGELIISFEDGGQVNITNFETFTEGGNLLYLSDGTLVDATILTSAPLNPMALNNIETAAGTVESSTQTISKPSANTSQEISVEQGVNYVCDFDPQNAALVEVKDGQMVLTFADGSQVVINNYNDAIAGQLPEELTVADAAVVEENLLTEVTEVVNPSEETLTVAQAEPTVQREPSAEQVANIEPAAGDNLDAVAQQLQNIEPAAGPTGISSGRGYGFSSSADNVTFGADPAVGPLNPTQLAYDIPQVRNEQFIEDVAAAPVDPEPTMNPEVITLDETNLVDGNLVGTGNVNANFGGDGNGGIEPNGRFEATCEVAGAELTSGGVPVIVETTETGYVGTADGVVVFTFEIDNSGEYVFTQSEPFDHADTNDTNEAICLEFGVRAIDGDGDRTGTTVKINVLDDAPELLSQVDVQVDETNTDADGKVSVEGQFFAEVGQDTAATYGGTGVVNSAEPLTSNGEAVTVTYDAATATYTGATATDTIFTLEMDTATGEYVFTLCGPLDHADATNPDDTIAIEFGAFVTDYDGDTAQGTFTVNVKDDAPSIEDSSAHVDETDGDRTTTGQLDVDFGYDGVGEICGNEDFAASVANLTSNGEAVDVTFDAATNTYTGSSASGDVFTLVIDAATGEYEFSLTAPLDHPDASDNDDEIVLDFGVKIEDNDGDQSTATISITVDDDGPEINSAQNVVDETDGNVTVTGTVAPDGGFDGVAEFCATGDFDSSGSQLAGALTSNGVAVEVSYDAATGTYTGAAGNDTIFTMTVDADGAYSFELLGTLDHADASNANDIINLDFGVKIEDNDGDTKESIIRILVKDDVPSIGDSSGNVDETNFDNGPLVYNDVLNTDFGADLAEISVDGNTDSSVALISNGQPVTINNSGNTYTGTTPNGDVIFTMVVNTATGEYEYTQFAPLEHPDSTNPDDVISIDFGVQITSNDGDSDTGTITITIADDGPVASDDINGAEEGQTITGDVTVNDDFSEDGGNTITNVNFEGTDYAIPANGSTNVTGNYGTLTINSDGTYSYDTNDNDPDGKDVFTYTLTDRDGDTDTAKLEITVTPDGQPIAISKSLAVDETNLTPGPMVFEGDLDVDFGIDGAGQVIAKDQFSASGSLKDGTFTSNDVAIKVTLDGDTYTGKAGDEVIFTLEVNTDGTYNFTLLSHIDHADATDPNDAISLDFGVMAMDADGDSAMGNINILIYDDAPVAYDDGTTTLNESESVSGNVTDNDELGEDKPNDVVEVIFNGVSTAVPATGVATIVGNYGTFTLASDGSYTYKANDNNPDGKDTFTYVLQDFDGDQDTAEITFSTNPLNDLPEVIRPAVEVVDETNFDKGDLTDTGTIEADFFGDGPGVIAGNDKFTSSTPLTSGGVEVNVSYDAATGTYTGTAGNETVFTVKIEENGDYVYTQKAPLDHPDATDSNDAINLNFGVVVTDKDGDTATTTLTVKVLDDGPVAENDGTTTVDEGKTVSGNVTDNDEFSEDGSNDVISVRFNGQNTSVPATGTATVVGEYGTLTISSDGSYSYTANDNNPDGTDTFSYVLEDFDGDKDRAEISFNTNPLNDTPTVVKPVVEGVDETNLDDGPLTLDGTIEANFFGDGPGTIDPNGTFNASTGDLVSCGMPVDVTVDGDVYTGTREDGVVIFTLEVKDNGDYNFTQFAAIDHPDGSDHNDVVKLDFGITATDKDGDTASTTLSINVYDDGPSIERIAERTYEEGLKDGPVVFTDTVPHDFGQDGAGTIEPTGRFVAKFQEGGPDVTLSSQGNAITVTETSKGYVGKTADGATVFTFAVNATTGKYTFTQNAPIDHPDATNPDDVIWLKFGVEITDKDGDTDQADIVVDLHDDGPAANNDTTSVGEGDTVSGNVVNNDEYGADGAGCVLSVTVGGKTYDVAETGTTTINGTYGVLKIQSSGQYTYTANDGATTQDVRDTFGYTIKDGDGDTSSAILAVNVSQVADPDYTPEINNSGKTVDETNFEDGMLMASGKLAVDYKGDEAGSVDPNGAFNISNGDLTSCDKPVTITSDTNGYTGTRADGVVVFTLTVQDNGSYKYTQFEAIDHPNTDDANDALTMRFGVTATDGDGDTDTATIAIKVLDDGPTISTKGHGLYESSKDAGGVLVRTGTMPHDFGQDGAGTIESNGNFAAKFQVGGQDQTLTSAGDEIFVTQTSTGYVGKLAGGKTVFKIDIDAQTGEFEYKQYEPVDHPDTSSSSEAIWLKFGVTITDKDGDTDDATMMIDLHDDGPDAKNDTKSGDSDGNISGNVTDNDDYGYDDAGSVIKVTFEGTTIHVPTTGSASIQGSYGTLTIASNGDYTYSPIVHGDNTQVQDVFKYTIQDGDGDTDVARLTMDLTLVPCPVDDSPEIAKKTQAINEEDLIDGVVTKSGTFDFDYGDDGAGSISTNGEVIVRDVVGGDNVGLYSCDKLVTIRETDNGYVGTRADGVKVFDVVINDAGQYTYKQYEPVDHPKIDQVDGDDVLWIKLGVTITDKDGDTATNYLQIDIRDDGPSVTTKGHGVQEYSDTDGDGVIGRVSVLPHSFGADGAGTLKVTGDFAAKTIMGGPDSTLYSNGSVINVTQSGNGFVGKLASGTVVFTVALNQKTGAFDYKQFEPMDHPDTTDDNEGIWLKFPVEITDKDGDTATATLIIDVYDDGPDAKNDTVSVTEGDTATGNVMANDDVGYDDDGCILKVQFGGNTVDVPATGYATIAGTNGTLKIKADGSYIYTPKSSDTAGQVTDKFTYTLKDGDGDTDTAILTVNTTLVADPVELDAPEGKNDFCTIVLPGQSSFSSNLIANDTFDNANGRIKSITFGGKSYNVAQTGTTVIAVAFGEIAVKSNGDYTFTVTDPNNTPTTSQNFDVTITDASGKTDTTLFQFNIVGSDLEGTEGKDGIRGSSADDIINGNGEEDTLYGEAGNDTIRGGDDNDYVDGGLGNDTLYGDGGNDLMAGREGNDTIRGGSGNDDIYGDGGVNYDYAGNDTIYGEAGDDYISGDKGRDTIYGGSGKDALYGGDGNDTIYGGTGNDDIIGGQGNDTLTGGDGADTFWFTAINEGLDTIKDFDDGEDKLDLSNMLTGFDAGEDINDFLFAVKSGGSTTIHANNNGDGNLNNARAIVKLEGEDLSINDLMANGNIIV